MFWSHPCTTDLSLFLEKALRQLGSKKKGKKWVYLSSAVCGQLMDLLELAVNCVINSSVNWGEPWQYVVHLKLFADSGSKNVIVRKAQIAM